MWFKLGICSAILVFLVSFEREAYHSAFPAWKVGEEYVFSYVNEMIAYSDISKIYSNDTSKKRRVFFGNEHLQGLKIHVSATIRQIILYAGKDNSLSIFQIDSPEIDAENSEGMFDIASVKNDITKPVIVGYDAVGHMMNIRIDSSISFSSERFLKDILSHFQFVRSVSDKNQWEETEDNANGKYNVRYRFLKKESNSSEYEKIKTGYLDMVSMNKAQHLEVESNGRILVDSNGILKTVHISEAEFALLGADTISAGGSRYSINLSKQQTVSTDAFASFSKLLSNPSYTKHSSLNAVHSEREIRELAYKHTLGHDNFESLQKKLTSELDSASKDKLILQFRALAYLFTTECTKMAELLSAVTPESKTYNIILIALAQAETSASVNALVAVLYNRRNELRVAMDILPILATTKAPTKQAAEIINKLAFDEKENETLRSLAQLSLAGLAYSFRKTDPERTQFITGTIYNSPLLDKDTVQKILCLANTGSLSAFPYLRGICTDRSILPGIRSRAVYGLKLIESDSVQSFLLKMKDDPDSTVSKSANDAITFRNAAFSGNN